MDLLISKLLNYSEFFYNRNMDLLISKQLSKSILDFGSGQTEITHKYVFAYFQIDHFPKSKIDFDSSFEIRRSIILLYKKKKQWSVLTNKKKS